LTAGCPNPLPYPVFLRAAEIYRGLRRKGITLRKPVDSMIASIAIENDIPLLHYDKDFKAIEEHYLVLWIFCLLLHT